MMEVKKVITEDEVKAKTTKKFWSKIKFLKEDECWEWQASCNPQTKYGMTSIDGTSITITSHRYMYMQLFSDFDKTLQVLHKCDNRKCVNPNHLFSGTQKDNMDDCARKERNFPPPHLFGSKQNGAILKEEDIPIIRQRVLGGETLVGIGRSYGVSKQVIWHIKKNKTWQHV